MPAAVADATAARASGSSSLGASALDVAKGELARGVREVGNNTGADVDKYLAAARVAPGNPWCASFVTWALEQSGRTMDGSGWAAVQTWVRSAEAGNNDLQLVSAEDARPGDLVAYDWGGQEDFGADGHIGFLASNVEDGKFTAVEGNYQDAVLQRPAADGRRQREVHPRRRRRAARGRRSGRRGGGRPRPPTGPGSRPAQASAAPDAGAAAQAEAAAAPDAPKAKKGDTMRFMAAKALEADRQRHATVQFMKAIDPKQQVQAAAGPVAPPEVAAAAAAPAGGPTAAEDAAMNQAVGAPVPANELALQAVGPIGTYPGDSASQDELAKWLAARPRRRACRPSCR